MSAPLSTLRGSGPAPAGFERCLRMACPARRSPTTGKWTRVGHHYHPIEPPCVRAMHCLCAGHARGNRATDPCDTREAPPCASCGSTPAETGKTLCVPCGHAVAVHGATVADAFRVECDGGASGCAAANDEPHGVDLAWVRSPVRGF